VTPDPVVRAIFGAGPITLYTGTGYIVEALDSDTVRLRVTAAGQFVNFGITHPTACTGNGLGNSGSAVTVGRYGFSVGDAISGDLCLEGSSMRIVAFNSNEATALQATCWRFAGNAIACQKH
jgi:hypothetical protein